MANPNRQFQVADAAAQQALVCAQPLATLVIAHAGTLHANPIPLYLDPARGPQGTLIGHVARAGSRYSGMWLTCCAPACAMTSVAIGWARTRACGAAASAT